MSFMVKLLLLYDQANTTTEVNLCGTKSVFGDGCHIFRVKSSRMVTSDDLNWCDACYANRPSSIYMVRVARSLRASGRIFMPFYDDDLLNLPRGNSGRWKKNYVKKCIIESDIIITPNPLISRDYKKISPHTKHVVIDSYINEEDIKPIPQKSDKVRIVYAAGGDHTELFDKYIKPILKNLHEKYPFQIDLTLIGVHPNLLGFKHNDWIHQIDTMPYEQYKDFMRTHDFDIGLAPLDDNPFSNRKYFNKFLEYSKNGILGMFSNCLPYTLIVENGVNGILVDNSISAWYDALCNTIDQLDQKKEMVEVSQRQLRNLFSIESIRSIISKEIDSVIISKDEKLPVCYENARLSEFSFEVLSKWHQFSSHVYRNGLKTTIFDILKKNKNNSQ